MGLDLNLRRRWFGAVVLTGALGMLLAGETILKDRLQDFGFLVYWLVCFCLTGLAVIVALLDARSLRRSAQEQRRDLLDTAIKDIQLQAEARSDKKSPGPSP